MSNISQGEETIGFYTKKRVLIAFIAFLWLNIKIYPTDISIENVYSFFF